MVFSANILVIDDEESMRAGCIQTLTENGYRVQAVENGRMGLERIAKESFDVILLDLKMPGIQGTEVLKKLKENDPNLVVIIITAYGTIDSAVEAMKRGAYDFLTKPFTPETLNSIVKRAVDSRLRALEEACVSLVLDKETISKTIIGQSDAIAKLSMLIKKVAATDSTVLITGETGVGKELVAQSIHRLSGRADKPFVTVDCGVLVESLFESEMFGHTRGSFTGAIETTQGKFELANGGTVFLDEVANISINMQARLLRVIEEREISKVGGLEKINVDVRIIAATNKSLLKEIYEGRFREDLFYRLNVVPINIPPLRERRQDIGVLAKYFLKRFRRQKKKAVTSISAEAMRSLEMYDWPGNVRELRNTIERAIVTCEGKVIELDDLSFNESTIQGNISSSGTSYLEDMEREKISKVLRQFDGHKTKAAEYLGINRKTLREKIRKYKIKVGS
ncbi:MAG: sigma-54 dependent transcriptional regulator [Sedimentisphaerales bacterium]